MKKYLYKFGIHLLRIYWFVFKPTTSGVKCLIENSKQEILFIRNTYGSKKWNLPGGKIEKGESPEEAVRREVREELNIYLGKVAEVKSFLSTLEYKKDKIFVFRSQVLDNKFKVDKKEISDAKWSPASNPPRPLSKIAELALGN